MASVGLIAAFVIGASWLAGAGPVAVAMRRSRDEGRSNPAPGETALVGLGLLIVAAAICTAAGVPPAIGTLFVLGSSLVAFILVNLNSWRGRALGMGTVRILPQLRLRHLSSMAPVLWGTALSLIVVLPQVASDGTVWFVSSVGPDAIGYAVAGQAVARGLFLPDLSRYLNEAGIVPQLVAMGQGQAVYDLSSFTAQIQAEFLVGARRLGGAGVQGQLIALFGLERTFLVQVAFALASLILTNLFLIARLRHFVNGQRLYVLTAVAVTVTPTLIYAFNQGGVAQIWVFPFVVAMIAAAAGMSDSRMATPLIAIGSAVCAASYLDALYASAIVLALLSALVALRVSRIPSLFTRLAIGLTVGLMLYPLSAMTLLANVRARVADVGQGGWGANAHLSLDALLGLTPLFLRPLRAVQTLPVEDEVWLVVGSLLLPVIILGAVALTWRRVRGVPLGAGESLALAALGAIAVVSAYTQFANGNSNYQVIKASVYFVPMVFLGIAYAIGEAAPSSRLSSRSPRAHLAWLAGVSCTFLILFNSFRLISDLRSTSDYTPDLAHSAYNETTLSQFERFAFVVPAPNLGLASLASLGDFHWVNRPFGQVQRVRVFRAPPELALLLPTSAVAQDGRLADSLLAVVPGYQALPLGAPTGLIDGLPPGSVCEASTVLVAVMYDEAFSDCGLSVPLAQPQMLGWNAQQSVFSRESVCPVSMASWSGTMLIPTSMHGTWEMLTTGDEVGSLVIERTGEGHLRAWVRGSALPAVTAEGLGQGGRHIDVLRWAVMGGTVRLTLNGVNVDLQSELPLKCSRISTAAAGLDPGRVTRFMALMGSTHD